MLSKSECENGFASRWVGFLGNSLCCSDLVVENSFIAFSFVRCKYTLKKCLAIICESISIIS